MQDDLKILLAQYEAAITRHRTAFIAYKYAADTDDPGLPQLRSAWLASCDEVDRLGDQVAAMQRDPESSKDND